MKNTPAPILDPSFKWISSATHDADSNAFRARQRKRMREAEAARLAKVAVVPAALPGKVITIRRLA